jgi:Putative Actinobacterial Holin-X, holin superfamily III
LGLRPDRRLGVGVGDRTDPRASGAHLSGAELQAKLAAVDFKDAARKSVVPLLLTVVGLTVVVASVPMALFGTGWLLASALKIHQGWAMLPTAGAAVALGGAAVGLGASQLRHSFERFRRSRLFSRAH